MCLSMRINVKVQMKKKKEKKTNPRKHRSALPLLFETVWMWVLIGARK